MRLSQVTVSLLTHTRQDGLQARLGVASDVSRMVAAVELLDRVLQHDVDALLAEVDVVDRLVPEVDLGDGVVGQRGGHRRDRGHRCFAARLTT